LKNIEEHLSILQTKEKVAHGLSLVQIDSLKIQEEKHDALTLLSGSENSSISNIEWAILMHTALIFKEQILDSS
jgi:hypothetical protein